jgi:histidine triad (HIT) family protein
MASIFSRILAGELPGHFIWKDEHCFAILTIQPIRDGHLLVIPNAEVNHWDDVPADIAAHLMQVSQHIAKGIKAVIPCKRVGVTVIGLEVPHTHIHLIPLDSMMDMDFARQHAQPAEKLAATAKQIREALLTAGHSQAQLA